jgi:hypothetical protein
MVGPDMNKPMSPTDYLTRSGLHALIRDPTSVRNWPGMVMPGFPQDRMSDREIDLVIDYLAHMAARRTSQQRARSNVRCDYPKTDHTHQFAHFALLILTKLPDEWL